MIAILIITWFSTEKIIDQGVNRAVQPIGSSAVSFIGYAIYTFEGIGTLMPCMQACECPEKFDEIVTYAVGTLTIMFIAYGNLAYLAYGPL